MSEKRKNMKLLKPKIDVVFQSLFSKKNEKITKAFAEAILDEKVRKITINDDKELFRERPEDKLGILDFYKKAKRVVMVAILDYDLDLTKEIKNMETIWQLREKNARELV